MPEFITMEWTEELYTLVTPENMFQHLTQSSKNVHKGITVNRQMSNYGRPYMVTLQHSHHKSACSTNFNHLTDHNYLKIPHRSHKEL